MTNRYLDTARDRTRIGVLLVQPARGWHDEPLPPDTLLLVADTPLESSTPLHLFLPGTPDAWAPLVHLTRSCAPAVRELTLRSSLVGPDAETELIEQWEALAPHERSRVWGAVGTHAGVLARFPGRAALGFALLDAAGRAGGDNGQSRFLLMADLADSWSLALDREQPVDAERWRLQLASVLDSLWQVGFLDEAAAALEAFARQLAGHDGGVAGADVPAPAPAETAAGVTPPPVAWLDAELLAPRRRLALIDARARRRAPRPAPPAPAKDLSFKVVRGRRGRLFLTRDSHDSHRQLTGDRRLSSDELDAWRRGTGARLAFVADRGSRFLQLVGPAPQAVHPDDLPDGQQLVDERPVRQIQQALAATAPDPLIYPIGEMRHARRVHDPFSKTDSHWNDLGTFLAYEALLDRLGSQVPLRRLSRSDVTFHDTCYVGDLGVKLLPQRASVFVRATIDDPRARLVEDNRVRNHGRYAVFECDAAPRGTCVVFGDSWAYSLMLFLAETFRRVVFYHRVNVVDREPIERERPSLVLSVLTERFCTALPHDDRAPAFTAVAAQKIALGDLVPVPGADERHPFLFSLSLERGLPASGGFRLRPRD